ncbi:MAG TPA: hypothetical protein VFP98_04015 [Candidatus Polarisedimenticolia bacterium]|nr:hypothetical protein [Candidatus Polarisedimenticolia bacterium]
MLLFRSEEHVERWCRTWRVDRGGTLSLEQVWGLARAWYTSDRRAPDWQRYSVEEAEAILRGIGLVDEFWNLRA